MNMAALITASVVHFYDVRSRETLCGLRGFEHRSTKKARGVTCTACVGLLHDRSASSKGTAPEGAGGSPANA
jgi:hypothetical protein